ncbi:MAG: alpha/beta hydrolase [Chloroflexota bacterium]|nr:alpha/beta hydrolase [Dehalococcoidia bacterium]MDW8046976.1 alpha/beta hydrolase [Chloroflexota bacterium]
MERPKVLLLHGYLSTSTVWRRAASFFEHCEPEALDLPGYGRTPPPPGGLTLESVTEAVASAAARIRPAAVVGHSMGAVVALALARHFPEVAPRVGVIGLPVYRSREEARRFVGRRGLVYRFFLWNDAAAHAVCCELGRRTLPLWAPAVERRFPQYDREVLASAFAHDAETHRQALERLVFGCRLEEWAADVPAAVAALHGTADGAAPLGRARALAQRLGWRWEEVPGASHEVPLEQPALTARWVESLLERP